MSIIQIKLEPSPNHSRYSPHYFLSKEIKSFSALVTMFFEYFAKSEPSIWQNHVHYIFMSSQLAQQMIKSDLVRHVLSQKKTKIYRSIHFEKSLKRSDKNYKKFPKSVCISFPIRAFGIKITDMDPGIHNGKDEADSARIKKIINNYYEKIEEKEIILPILYLIQISPSALKYFLSDWNSWYTEDSYTFGSSGLYTIEYILFRLIWNTVNDLSIIRDIPTYGDAYQANVSGDYSSTFKSLLHLSCKDRKTIDYNASFDTDHFFSADEGGNVYELQTNPESCHVTIISDI